MARFVNRTTVARSVKLDDESRAEYISRETLSNTYGRISFARGLTDINKKTHFNLGPGADCHK